MKGFIWFVNIEWKLLKWIFSNSFTVCILGHSGGMHFLCNMEHR